MLASVSASIVLLSLGGLIFEAEYINTVCILKPCTIIGLSVVNSENVIVIVEVRDQDREAAIDRIVASLAQFKPVVLRRFDIPLGFSVSIERTGLSALQQHPAVLKTQVDVPVPPTGGGVSAPQ